MTVSMDRARADSASINARLAGLLRAATVEVYEKNSPKVLDSFFAAGADVYISYLPGDDFRSRIEIAKVLRGAGYNPIVHVPARQMMTRQMLADYVGALVQEAQVKRLLLIAGDTTRARGDYATSLQVIESGLLQQLGVAHVDVAGHPEGNVGLSHERLMKVLADKRDAAKAAGLGFGIVTQFSFDPRPVEQWLGAMRAVSKAEDASPGEEGAMNLTAAEFRKYLDSLPEDERGQLQLRAALKQPIPLTAR